MRRTGCGRVVGSVSVYGDPRNQGLDEDRAAAPTVLCSARSTVIGMGEYYDKIAALREDRRAAAAALDEIEGGATIMINGINLTEQRLAVLSERSR